MISLTATISRPDEFFGTDKAAVFAAQLVALEQEYALSFALLKMLGRAFGFGAAGKLERARFKVSYKRQQLAEFESLHHDWRPER
jgi:hypothetical protein